MDAGSARRGPRRKRQVQGRLVTSEGITEDGTIVFNRALRRTQVLRFFEGLAPCLIGMEACGSSHYWARELAKLVTKSA